MKNQKIRESKKFIAAFVALICVMAVYIVGVTLIVKEPKAAGEINSLSNLVITFIVSLFSMLILGQSAVDYKNTSLMQTEVEQKTSHAELLAKAENTENKNINVNISEHVVNECDPGAPERRPFRSFDEEEE